MNNQSCIHRGVRFSWRSMVLNALLMLALAGFTGCATDSMPPSLSADQAHSEMIILREGDELKITFPGSPNLDSTQQIRRDGKIVMPLIGEVQAAGMTPDALRQSLVKLYASQISSQEINVFVTSSTFPVFVSGAVIHPGKILSDHPITALEAVMEAGGFDYTTANTKDVKIIRNEGGKMKNYRVNLQRILDGSEGTPFYLKPQDIIYVPQRFQIF
jgi:polysaccharide export outer membrane protein